MAILPRSDAPMAAPHLPVEAIDIENWTQQAMQALSEVAIASSDNVRGTSVSLAIDLDEKAAKAGEGKVDTSAAHRPRREPIRRDSQKRREALLKGKEGSRRRRQWENGRFIMQCTLSPISVLTLMTPDQIVS